MFFEQPPGAVRPLPRTKRLVRKRNLTQVHCAQCGFSLHAQLLSDYGMENGVFVFGGSRRDLNVVEASDVPSR